MNLKSKILSLLAASIFVVVSLFPQTGEAVSIDDLRIYGYFDLEYDQSNNSQGNKNGSFDNHHFNLLMDFPVSNKLIVKSHIEFEHGTDTKNDFGTAKVEWVFLEYSFLDELHLRGGKFFSPFGFYNELRDSTPAFLSLDVPTSIYFAQARGGFDFMPQQNTGISVWGQSNHTLSLVGDFGLDYSLYVGNGENTSTTNPSEFDDNADKAIGGRVNLYPNDTFRFGVSFFTGEKAISSSLDSRHSTVGLSMGLDIDLFNLTGEGVYSKLNGTEQYAGYVQASLQMGIFSPYYRYEQLDPDVSIPDDTWETHIIGLNSNLVRGLYLKTEIDFHDRGKDNSLVTQGQTTYHEYRASVVVAF